MTRKKAKQADQRKDEMIKIEPNRACVVHGHNPKKDSATDRPKGSIIKCYSFADYGRKQAIEKAHAMHYAIAKSEASQGQEFQPVKIQSMFLLAEVQEMAESEIRLLVDPQRLAEIRKTDAKPHVRAYVVGHEGFSKGKLLGIGDKIKTWYRQAIQKLVEKLKIGTKIFSGHEPGTNDHQGRIQVGELIGKTVKYIDGKMKAIAAIYLRPEFTKNKFDVPSIEGDLIIQKNGDQIEVADVSEISGIALGDSDQNKPGFPEAQLLTSFQMFAGQGNEVKMNLKELKAEIKNAGYTIEEIWEKGDLENDPFISEIRREARKKSKDDGEFRNDPKLEKELERIKTSNLALVEENKKHQLKNQKAELQAKLPGIFDQRKLDDKQKAFVQKQFEKFSIDSDKPEESLQKFMDSCITEYKELTMLFGIAKPEPDKADKEKTEIFDPRIVQMPGPMELLPDEIAKNPLIPR